MYEDPFTNAKDIAEYFGMNVHQLYNLAHKKGFVRGTYQEFGYQKCSTCKQVLEANEVNFYVNKNNKNGLGYECKPCARKRRMEVYKTKKGVK